MTTTAKPSELLPAHKVLLERIERLKRWSDNGCHMKIHGPSAGEAYELALELESMLASRPPPSEQAGDWPELPEAFDSVLVDDFTNLSIPVFAEWQMRAYGEVCRASRPAAVDVPNRFISDGLYSVADVYIRRPAKPCKAEPTAKMIDAFHAAAGFHQYQPSVEAGLRSAMQFDPIRIAQPCEAVPNSDSGLEFVKLHGLFVYEVDFGDEGKGSYIRLADFNRVASSLGQPQPYRVMQDGATLQEYLDQPGVGALTPVDKMAIDNKLHEVLAQPQRQGQAVMWRAPQKSGGFMFFDYNPTHLMDVQSLHLQAQPEPKPVAVVNRVVSAELDLPLGMNLYAEQPASAAGDFRDQVISALERAVEAETCLRELVDECGNDMTVGWEGRMAVCIRNANDLLAAAPGVKS